MVAEFRSLDSSSQMDGCPMDGHPQYPPLYRRALHLALVLVIGAFLVFAPSGANADQLDDLRAGGQVGERADGFLEARDGGAQGFVNEINAKRRGLYQKLANESGATAAQVAMVTGIKQIEKAAPNALVVDTTGNWVRAEDAKLPE